MTRTFALDLARYHLRDLPERLREDTTAVIAVEFIKAVEELEAAMKVVEAAEKWRTADAELSDAVDEATYRGTPTPSKYRHALYATTEPLRAAIDQHRAAKAQGESK